MDKTALRERILIVLVLSLTVMNCFIGWELLCMKKALNSAEVKQGGGNAGSVNVELTEMINSIQASIYSLQGNMNTLNNAVLADKVEEICEGKSSDEEKAIAVAQWICSNVANREYDYPKNNVQNSTFGWFATRNGLCNARANIFIEMMGFLNLDARIMNLYDFPSAQSGHSAAEVYYDDKWHFLDPNSGGYFRSRNGAIMSLEEMRKNPEEAMAGMVVFEETLDKVDNYERMNDYYTVDSLGAIRSYAPMSRSETAVVYPTVDMGVNEAWQIGELNDNDEDVRLDGMELDLSQYLNFGLALPTTDADVQTEWSFTNCDAGRKYYLEYDYYGGAMGEFQAVGDKAKIMEGDTLKIEEDADENGKGTWRIVFIPDSEECTIRIRHDYMEARVGAKIDRIRINNIDNEKPDR